MKNKGFTLVELLAVIVILAVISIITIPLIGNVIKDSKKKALETSVYGLVEAANYFTISNDGVYGFLFNENKKGETKDGEYSLDYKGEIDAEGELYIDSNGDISLCLENEDYYVYKNYNSGIYTGNISEDSCELKFDPLTNKYIAYLESEGEGINVYTKEEVNNLIDIVNTNVTNNTNEITSIRENINEIITSINNNTNAITTNANEISNIKGTIETLQSSLNDYALQSSIDTTNNNLETLSSIVSTNQSSISELQNNTNSISTFSINPIDPYYYKGSPIRFFKVGRIVVVTVGSIQNLESSKEIIIISSGSIPEEFRPHITYGFSTTNTNGGLSRLFYSFRSDGSVSVYNYGSFTGALNIGDTFYYISN